MKQFYVFYASKCAVFPPLTRYISKLPRFREHFVIICVWDASVFGLENKQKYKCSRGQPSWKDWGRENNINHVCYSHIDSLTFWLYNATLSIDSWKHFLTAVFWRTVNHHLFQPFSLWESFLTYPRSQKPQRRSITKVWVVWRVSFCTHDLPPVPSWIVYIHIQLTSPGNTH